MTGAAEAWPVHPLARALGGAGLRVEVTGTMPALPPGLEAVVAGHWDAARAERPALFNGRIFSVDTITPTRLGGHWSEYRRLVAQMRDGALHAVLGVRSLSVCGVLLCRLAGSGRPAVVFGQRHRGALYQAGLWQMPPAGSVDDSVAEADGSVDLRRQVLTELREELGLDPAGVLGVEPLCMVEHPGSGLLDLGLMLRTVWDEAAVRAAHARAGNDEYANINIVALDEALPTIDGFGDGIVPPARIFLRHVLDRLD